MEPIEREERAAKTADFLYSWGSIGPVLRLACAIAIIAACVWTVAQLAGLIIWISLVLQP